MHDRAYQRDMQAMRSRMGSIHTDMENMRSELLQLRVQNNGLHQSNEALARDNRRLQRHLADAECQKEERAFDVIAHHYQTLAEQENHRKNTLELEDDACDHTLLDSRDADFAAGGPAPQRQDACDAEGHSCRDDQAQLVVP